MTHPEDLLADYVDGTLPEDERAVVAAHLPSCTRCREEVEFAARATAALSSLPEEPVPFGVTAPVLAEARRAVGRKPAWARLQWAVGVAAAACLVLLAVITIPRFTDGSEEGEALRAPAAEAGADQERDAALQAAPRLEVLSEDLDERDLRRLARETARLAPAVPEAPSSAVSAPDEAVACLLSSGATVDDRDVLVRIIEAPYLGTPAYLGVFHEGPGGERPPERVVVWVVAREDCAILTLLSQNV